MDKRIAQEVWERSGGLCELCHGNHMVQRHHIIGGSGKRSQCETLQSVICLCYECHHGSKWGIHGKNGEVLSKRLKRELQTTYEEMGYSREKIFKLMGDRFYEEGEDAS